MNRLSDFSWWKPGDQILQQDLWNGLLLTSRPVTVVEDGPELLALYTHPRSPVRSAGVRNRTEMPLSERISIFMSQTLPRLEERLSGNRHVLTLTPPESSHSVWYFWSEEWELQRIYVNLQEPIERTDRGVLVRDLVLDITIGPDRSWAWKDEDEFSELHRQGYFSDQEALSIRAEGERMIEVLQANKSPFCDGWEQWRPPDGWQVPVIPVGWDALAETIGD